MYLTDRSLEKLIDLFATTNNLDLSSSQAFQVSERDPCYEIMALLMMDRDAVIGQDSGGEGIKCNIVSKVAIYCKA